MKPFVCTVLAGFIASAQMTRALDQYMRGSTGLAEFAEAGAALWLFATILAWAFEDEENLDD